MKNFKYKTIMKVKSFIKVLNLAKYVAMAALLVGTTAACSDDDDDNNGSGSSSFETPKYEAEAAKYVINDQSTSPYKSIELTASGNFIIQPSDYVNNATQKAPAKGKKTMVQRLTGMLTAHNAMPQTRYEVNTMMIAYGKYTKTGENQYDLDGFGTLTIKKDADGTTRSIILTRTGQEPAEYTAHEQKTNPDSEMTSKLCRTWNIESYRYSMKVNGRLLLDFTGNTIKELAAKMKAWAEKNDPEFDESDWDDEDVLGENNPKDVIFTKTGTYMVLYSNDWLAVSTWAWENEKNGILRYSWNPDNLYDDDYSGEVKVEFNNNKLHLIEFDIDEDEDDGTIYEENVTYIMHEVK